MGDWDPFGALNKTGLLQSLTESALSGSQTETFGTTSPARENRINASRWGAVGVLNHAKPCLRRIVLAETPALIPSYNESPLIKIQVDSS